MSKLGVYDSGLGGYTIAKAIREHYPQQDLVFLADQKYVPYGNRTEEELEAIIHRNMAWFYAQGIRQVIIACNTTSVLPLSATQKAFPDLQLRRIIDLTAEQLKEESLAEVLVVATRVTIASHAYQKAIQAISPKTVVHEICLPNLAGLVEAMADADAMKQELDLGLSSYYQKQIPVILACTHYPLVKEQFEQYLLAKTYDSIKPILQHKEFFTAGKGIAEYYTTGDLHYFQKQLAVLFHQEITPQFAEIPSISAPLHIQ